LLRFVGENQKDRPINAWRHPGRRTRGGWPGSCRARRSQRSARP
jgi:hypothetical protein